MVRCEIPMDKKTCMVDTWRPMDDALMKEKSHKASGSQYDLFMNHVEVLKPTKRQIGGRLLGIYV